MRACGGVWVAHGSGDADREVARARGRLPPDATPLHAPAASGSPRRRRTATTTASPTKACGRSATSCTTGRSSAPTTGSSTRRSTRSSPPPCSRRCETGRAADGPGPGLPLRAAAALIKRASARTRASRSSGTSRGRTPRRSASARGRTEILLRACSAPTCSASTPSSTATTSWRRWTARSRRRIDREHFIGRAGPARHPRCKPFPISVAPDLVDEPPRHDAGEPCCASSGIDRGVPRASASSASTTPRASPSASAAIRRFFEQYPEYRGRMVVRAARRAEPEPHPALPGAAGRRSTRRCRTDQRARSASGAGGRSSI